MFVEVKSPSRGIVCSASHLVPVGESANRRTALRMRNVVQRRGMAGENLSIVWGKRQEIRADAGFVVSQSNVL
jgi:hypothetical protein